MESPEELKTGRTRLRRRHDRGSYDRESVYAILDAMPLCHVGYIADGAPAVTPTLQWREGDTVYWHGSSASRALRASAGADVCLTVTHFDGFVLARSAFHHSANYRSVMIYGKATPVEEKDHKAHALKAFVDGLFPGRWDELRPVTEQEIKATTVLSMPIDEASAKVRTGPPGDDEADYALPIWAGLVPVGMNVGDPIPDPKNLDGVKLPESVRDFALTGNRKGQ